jgi:hypothetical protein
MALVWRPLLFALRSVCTSAGAWCADQVCPGPDRGAATWTHELDRKASGPDSPAGFLAPGAPRVGKPIYLLKDFLQFIF